ncbi:aquaporin-3-like isoform X2 [Uloborus diversus]|uniref:aquaporin-3-like isoform X2 n=1 Tax=Uloborus diversus TaxID=327109 RepID=UPI00240A4920|nr:aquaporin-3-like isoform X2 [Uloborus diversus]
MGFNFLCRQTYWISGRPKDNQDHPDYNYKSVDTKVKKFREKLNNMKCRNDLLRETLAEFFGTFLLTLIGNAVIASIVFSEAGHVGSVAGPLGWGLALMLAIAVTGGVSGSHLNPAVSVAFATVGKLEWKKVIPFMFAQYAGAFVSSIVLYAVYFESFSHFDGGSREIPPHASATAQIFATFVPDHVGVISALGDQIVGTMLLMIAIVAVTDPHNMTIPKNFYPLYIGLSLTAIIFGFALNCGAPLNPARDLSPRMFTALAGWGKHVFSFRDYNYFWVPVVGPHIGAVIGAWAYRLLIEQHWPVDSYDFGGPVEIKTNGEFKKKEDLPFIDKKRIVTVDGRKAEE